MKKPITPAWEIACVVTVALLMVGEAAPSSCERDKGWGRRVGNSGDPIYFCSR